MDQASVRHDEVAVVQGDMVGRERAARTISPANAARALQLWGLVDRGPRGFREHDGSGFDASRT